MENKHDTAKLVKASVKDQELFDEEFLGAETNGELVMVICWATLSLLFFVIFFCGSENKSVNERLIRFMIIEIPYSIFMIIVYVSEKYRDVKFEYAERYIAEVTVEKVDYNFSRYNSSIYITLSEAFTGAFSSLTGKPISIKKEFQVGGLTKGDKLILLVEFNGKDYRERLVMPESTKQIIDSTDRKDARHHNIIIPQLKYFGISMLLVLVFYAITFFVVVPIRDYILK